MTRLYVNNFRTTLAAAITTGATTITLNTVTGLPTITGSNYYYLTIDGGNGTYEIVKVTAAVSTTLSVTRAQESTTAVAWSAGAVVEMRATATTHVDIENDTRNWNTTGYINVGGGSSVSSLRFLEASANGTNYVGFQAPSSLAANKLWVLPSADGTTNQVLKTDGSGNLGWISASTSVSSDATPSLGGNLSVAGYKITSVSNGDVAIEPNGTGAILFGGNSTQPAETRWMEASGNGTNYVGFKAASALAANVVWTLPSADGTANQFLKTDGAGLLSWGTASGGSGITAVVQDTAPQLGGNLDVNAKKITSATNGDVIIEPNGTGAILIGGNATQTTDLRFMETSGNGTNYVGFKAPAALSANKIWTLPSADGTANQVLKTDGSGALGWATAGGGSGAMSFIASATASSSATIDFTGLGSYSIIKFIIVDLVPVTNNTSLMLRTSTNNGTSYDAGATDYTYTALGYNAAGSYAPWSNATYSSIVISAGQGNGAGQSLNGEFDLYNPTGTLYRHVSMRVISHATQYTTGSGHGCRLSSADVDAVRFLFGSGNISSGTIYVYGVSKT